MALTPEQIETIETLLSALDAEVNTIIESRDNVRALIRIDTVAPNAVPDDMALLQILKSRASVAANNLVGLLA